MAWHSGGTLQNATLAQWQAASDHNRLATCSMLVIDALMQQGVAPNEMDIAEIKPWAIKLQTCISEASGRGDAQDRNDQQRQRPRTRHRRGVISH